MLAGILLIAAGVLIALYPPLLAWIVAAFFILTGVMALSIGWYDRRHARRHDNPLMRVFLRF
jgi:hypothetical protein